MHFPQSCDGCGLFPMFLAPVQHGLQGVEEVRKMSASVRTLNMRFCIDRRRGWQTGVSWIEMTMEPPNLYRRPICVM